MPADGDLRCLWIKLGDRLAVLGFRPASRGAPGHDIDIADRLAPVDVWCRGGASDDQVWLWGTGLIELTVAGYRCHLAYAAAVEPAADAATIIAETAASFVGLCDQARG
jgi:hypothetical protein